MADFEGEEQLKFEDENVSKEELYRLRVENRDLQEARDKLVKKLDKKKNELENERTNTTTFRQYIDELNRKVELLEREASPLVSPLRIDLGPGLTGDVIERLAVEKTGLENTIEEQRTEIETLKSEISSMKTRQDLTNQDLENARGETIDVTTHLDDVRRESELGPCQKCSALGGEKCVLERQVDVLNLQIGELSEEREKWERQMAELEATLQSQLQKSHNQTEETQQTETVMEYEQRITELTNEITRLNKELTSMEETATINKQLIAELNQHIEVLESNNNQTTEQDLERKITEMAYLLADRETRIYELSLPVGVQQGKGGSSSKSNLLSNPKVKDKEKSQSKGKEVKCKSSDSSIGATPDATNMDLTPEVIPQTNTTGKAPLRLNFRGENISMVKLKALPNVTECVPDQVICTVNKQYELGRLMCIIELPAKGFRGAVSKHAGIMLFSPVGSCDGAYKGNRYFECPPNYGIFVPFEDVYVPVI